VFCQLTKKHHKLLELAVHWYFYVLVRPYAQNYFLLSLIIFFDRFKVVLIIIIAENAARISTDIREK
jgi:hypothetical protein